MQKKVKVTIELILDIPYEWDIVTHQDGLLALYLGNGKYMDVTYTPLITEDKCKGAIWNTDYEESFVYFIDEIISEYSTSMEFIKSPKLN